MLELYGCEHGMTDVDDPRDVHCMWRAKTACAEEAEPKYRKITAAGTATTDASTSIVKSCDVAVRESAYSTPSPSLQA